MKRLCIYVLTVLTALSAFTYEAKAQDWGPGSFGTYHGGMNSDGSIPSKCYRGIVEWSNGASFDYGVYLTELSGSYGYQFASWFYLGGYLSVGTTDNVDVVYFRDPEFRLCLGVDARAYMSKGKFSPFIGAQLGVDYGERLYANGLVGARYAINQKNAINISLKIGTTRSGRGYQAIAVGYEF